MLCVLLAHAAVVYYSLVELWSPLPDVESTGPLVEMEIIFLEETADRAPYEVPQLWTDPPLPNAPMEQPESEPGVPPPGESQAPDFVDWPVEQRISAKRALEMEREAERVAKVFSGPDGTWAALTKRERSRLKKFRWKPGIDGFEYDDKGNAIFHISDGCVVVNMAFIGCALGKAKVHGDLFKDMRLYFDEQRLPQTDDGNGTEPEALRPAN